MYVLSWHIFAHAHAHAHADPRAHAYTSTRARTYPSTRTSSTRAHMRSRSCPSFRPPFSFSDSRLHSFVSVLPLIYVLPIVAVLPQVPELDNGSGRRVRRLRPAAVAVVQRCLLPRATVPGDAHPAPFRDLRRPSPAKRAIRCAGGCDRPRVAVSAEPHARRPTPPAQSSREGTDGVVGVSHDCYTVLHHHVSSVSITEAQIILHHTMTSRHITSHLQVRSLVYLDV